MGHYRTFLCLVLLLSSFFSLLLLFLFFFLLSCSSYHYLIIVAITAIITAITCIITTPSSSIVCLSYSLVILYIVIFPPRSHLLIFSSLHHYHHHHSLPLSHTPFLSSTRLLYLFKSPAFLPFTGTQAPGWTLPVCVSVFTLIVSRCVDDLLLFIIRFLSLNGLCKYSVCFPIMEGLCLC